MAMGKWRLAFTLALLLPAAGLAGCVDDVEEATHEDDEGDHVDTRAARAALANGTLPAEDAASSDRVGDERQAPASVPAPDLEAGWSWTYATAGVYNTGDAFTIVVAEAGPDGYLFAGAGPEDVVEDVVWGRTWFGPMDRDLVLDPQRASGTFPEAHIVLFDFPLEDGKTWDSGAATVTARATDVPGPNGLTLPGFKMTLGSDGPTWTYAPSIGYLTSYRSNVLDIVIDEVGTSDSWTWYEPGPRVSAWMLHADTMDVPAESDAVIASAGGQGAAAATVTPAPGGVPWTFQTSDTYGYEYVILPANEGAWSASAVAGAGSTGGVDAVAVTWLQ
jgi:hypothetical protein